MNGRNELFFWCWPLQTDMTILCICAHISSQHSDKWLLFLVDLWVLIVDYRRLWLHSLHLVIYRPILGTLFFLFFLFFVCFTSLCSNTISVFNFLCKTWLLFFKSVSVLIKSFGTLLCDLFLHHSLNLTIVKYVSYSGHNLKLF